VIFGHAASGFGFYDVLLMPTSEIAAATRFPWAISDHVDAVGDAMQRLTQAE